MIHFIVNYYKIFTSKFTRHPVKTRANHNINDMTINGFEVSPKQYELSTKTARNYKHNNMFSVLILLYYVGSIIIQ